jgi:hypothetical protein
MQETFLCITFEPLITFDKDNNRVFQYVDEGRHKLVTQILDSLGLTKMKGCDYKLATYRRSDYIYGVSKYQTLIFRIGAGIDNIASGCLNGQCDIKARHFHSNIHPLSFNAKDELPYSPIARIASYEQDGYKV